MWQQRASRRRRDGSSRQASELKSIDVNSKVMCVSSLLEY